MYQSTVIRKSLQQGKETAPAPRLAIVMPFNPKMTPRHDLDALVQTLQASAEKQLLEAHSSDEAIPVIRRLQHSMRSLNFSTHRTAIALFVSTDMEKVLYLDLAVEPKVIVDRGFRVRDLADCKTRGKDLRQ